MAEGRRVQQSEVLRQALTGVPVAMWWCVEQQAGVAYA